MLEQAYSIEIKFIVVSFKVVLSSGTSEQINPLRMSALDEDDSTILPASNSTSENGSDLGTNNLSTATFEVTLQLANLNTSYETIIQED